MLHIVEDTGDYSESSDLQQKPGGVLLLSPGHSWRASHHARDSPEQVERQALDIETKDIKIFQD